MELKIGTEVRNKVCEHFFVAGEDCFIEPETRGSIVGCKSYRVIDDEFDVLFEGMPSSVRLTHSELCDPSLFTVMPGQSKNAA